MRQSASSTVPTGTVTFLFTDIEGSTRMWEAHPRAMQAAVARHDALLREAIEQSGGYVFKTVGDAFCSAFPTAQQALDAALASQRALQAVAWDGTGPIKVRMALHTGAAEVRAPAGHPDYFGQPLNRVARLLSTGHGGQILLTLATQQLVRDNLPTGTTLKDLGEGGLKDLVRAEHVYQVVAPDLPSDFLPLMSLDAQYIEPTNGIVGKIAQNPYKGLRAFQEADANDFFGREALTERLLARLQEEGPLTPFLAVVGPSGSGKSSVVRAGVIPALRQGKLPGSDRWLMVEMLPGAHPLEELDAVLLSIAANPPATLLDVLKEDERGLIRAVKRVLPRDESVQLVLVIDQFEEVFTLVQDEPARVHFLENLCAAVSDQRSRLRVIVTLRADFFDRPLLYPDPGELIRQRTSVVLPLSPQELERAIVKPAQRVGVSMDRDLVTAIVRDVAEQPGTLPLLQYALTELFSHRVNNAMTLDAYRATGGVLSALTRRADEIYDGLTEDEKEAARQLFLRLITLGEGVEDTRRRVRRAELSSIAGGTQYGHALDKVIELYGRYRLLTFDMDPVTKGPTVEVAHEALIKTWNRLQDWLDSSRSDLRMQRQLMQATTEWANASHDHSFLATGARLGQFEALAEGAERPGGVALTGEERGYLAASVEEREMQEAADRQRQAQELALQKRAASRLRTLVVAMGVFLVVAAGLSTFAFTQQSDANTQRQVAQGNAVLAQHNEATAVANEGVAKSNADHAEALRLASEADHLLQTGGNVEQIALLGIRSMNTQYTPQGDAALASALAQDYPRFDFTGQTGQIAYTTFSPDGNSVISTSYDHTAAIWDTRTGNLLHMLRGHTNSLNLPPFPSMDGKLLLTVSTDKTVRLWDTQTGVTLQTFADPDVFFPGISPDGKIVVIGGTQGVVNVYDAQSGQVLHVLQQYLPGQGTGVAAYPLSHFSTVADKAMPVGGFAPDGKSFITVGLNQEIVIWDTQNWQETRRTTYTETLGPPIILSPDGNTMAAVDLDNSAIWLWDVQRGQLLHRIVSSMTAPGYTRFSPNSKLLLATTADHVQRLWDVQSGQEVRQFDGNAALNAVVAFSPDGKTIAVGGAELGGDTTVRLLDVETGTELRRLSGLAGGARALDFSPDGKSLFVGTTTGAASLWDLHAPPVLPEFKGHQGSAVSAAFSSDGNYVLSVGADDKTAWLWDVHTGKALQKFVDPPNGGLAAGAVLSPDEKYVFSGSADHTLRMWDVQTGADVWHETFSSTVTIQDVRYSPDGNYVLSALNDTTYSKYVALLSDARTGAEVRRFEGHSAGLNGNAFSPDGKYILTGSSDKTARLWDLSTGKQVRSFPHPDQVGNVAFSADSKWAITPSVDGIARIWDVQTGQELKEFNSHGGSMAYSVASPDGKYLLTENIGTARLWDIQSGLEVRRFVGPPTVWSDVKFSPDGKYIITDAPDGAPQVLDVDYHDTIGRLCGTLARDFTDAEREQFSITDKEPTCPKP